MARMLLAIMLLFAAHPALAGPPAWLTTAQAQAKHDGYALVDLSQMEQLLRTENNLLLLDARADYEFEAGHIPSARNFPFNLADEASLPPAKRQQFIEALGESKDRPIIIYCRSLR